MFAPLREADFASAVTARTRYAFQPIVHVHTGDAFGFEALLRGVDRLGFATIAELFVAANATGATLAVELALLEAAVKAFAEFGRHTSARLFFNLNNRVLDVATDHHSGHVHTILTDNGLSDAHLCLELSESEGVSAVHAQRLLNWHHRPFIAIDDFGTGYSGLRVLVESKPDIVKIDRFFVAEVDQSQEKRTFLGQLVGLAHSIGLQAVAEGVETEGEFRVCRDVGCDFVQGFFIARPSVRTEQLTTHYPIVLDVNRRNRALRNGAADELRAELDTVAPISINARMVTVLESFRADRSRSFFPVVSDHHEPLGIVHEERLKSLIYSQFGRDLLTNRVQPHRVRDYLTPCLTFDVTTGIDRILNAIAQRPNDRAVLIADEGKYIGLLDTAAIIRTMHDRLLAMARDENPLTKLPGNVMVANYMAEAVESSVRPIAFAYFDFDYFKPFNDRFGFRTGDRAISMFAELMRRIFAQGDVFLGHIGGDDFFLGVRGPATEHVTAQLPLLLAQFRSDVESFYDAETRRRGEVEITERSGTRRMVPLLSVSCACALVGEGAVTIDAVSAMLAKLKTKAKKDPAKLALERFTPAE